MNLSHELYRKHFDEVFALYPKKDNKERSFVAYCFAVNNRLVTQDELIDKVKRYVHKMRGEVMYMPYFSKWLEDKRWLDDLPEIPKAVEQDSVSKAYTVIMKAGSGFASPEQLRWLKKWLKSNSIEPLREKLKPQDIKLIEELR